MEGKRQTSYRGGRGKKREVMEEMSGILIGVQVYLQEPIQPQTHTVTVIKYCFTVCECVCARGEKSPHTVVELFLVSLSSSSKQHKYTEAHKDTESLALTAGLASKCCTKAKRLKKISLFLVPTTANVVRCDVKRCGFICDNRFTS